MSTLALQLKKSVSFQNILIATDFSKASQGALKYAAGLAHQYGAKLHVLNVVPPIARTAIPVDSLPRDLDRTIAESGLHLKQFVASNLMEDLQHEEIVGRGLILEVVPELIADRRIDLLVVGTHGHSAPAQVLLGSVAEELFRSVACPVLTVGPAAREGQSPGVRRVLFATDFGPASARALPYAIDLAQETHGELILLHVVEPAPVSETDPFWHLAGEVIEVQKAQVALAHRRLDSLLPGKFDMGCKVKKIVACSFIPEGILKTAFEKEADLIVMGVSQSSAMMAALKSHIPWTTAHEVVRNATCPVLTVRA